MRYLNKIWVGTLLLFGVSAYMSLIYSPELSEFYGYNDNNVFFYKQLLSFIVSIAIIFGLSKLEAKNWFNKIGIGVFAVSLLLMLLMQVAPSSGVATIQGMKTYVVFDGIAIAPLLFLLVGLIWCISYLYNRSKNFKIILFSFLTLLVGIALYLIISPHRLERIKNWLSTLSVEQTLQSALHETLLLSIVDTFGIVGLVVVVGIFVGLFYMFIRKQYSIETQKYFAIGVSFLIGFVLFVNILYSFGLSPIAPTLHFIGHGASAILSTSLMVGMLLMQDIKEI